MHHYNLSALRLCMTRTYETREALERDINAAAKEAGFAIVIAKSSNWNKKLEAQGITKYTYYEYCCTSGHANAEKPNKKQAYGQIRKNCAFKAVGTYPLRGPHKHTGWRFEIKEEEHNHAPHSDPATIAKQRRLGRTDAVKEAIRRLEKAPHAKVGDIVDDLQAEFDIVVETHDIYNEIAAQKKADPNNTRSPFQRFLEILERSDDAYHTVGRNKDTDKIDRIFWAYPESIKSWRRDPSVMLYDATYCINRYDMPLVQANGVNELNKTFNMCFALVSGEKTIDHQWVLTQMRLLMTKVDGEEDGEDLPDEQKIDFPTVFVSDKHTPTRNACTAVFGDAVKQQLCLWHVMKNVAFNVKKKWHGSLEGTVLGEAGGGVGKRTTEDDDEVDDGGAEKIGNIASRLLNEEDRSRRHGGEADHDGHRTRDVPGRAPKESDREYLNNADGILLAWKDTVYADTEPEFKTNFQRLKAEFPDQTG